jgi:hypothetical protein
MFDIDVYRPDEVDLDEFAGMQRAAFKDLLEKMGVDNAFMTAEFYQWKYNGPFGRAKMSLAKDGGRIIASTVNQALEIQHNETTYRAWQNGDSAMLPQYRGKGLYHRCVGKAVASLEENELIYGFPNENSKRGFSAHVPVNKGVIPLLATPSVFPLTASGKYIAQVESFAETSLPPDLGLKRGTAALKKTSEYLAWRYDRHPVNSYTSFVYRHPTTADQAVVVTRKADIGGKRVLLVMELLGGSIRAMARVLHFAIRKQRTGVATLMFNNTFGTGEMIRLGFMKVPPPLLPKKQLLFVHGSSGAATALLDIPWLVQMGDWDGF